jgi:hypothetical protein
MRGFILFYFLLMSIAPLFAQDENKLFGTGREAETRHGFILSASGDLDLPAADMAKEFGTSYRVGPAVLYKTKSNWVFGVKCDFIEGNVIRQDSLMANIVDHYSAHSGNLYEFINTAGQRIGIPVYEKGYVIGLQAGKIIKLKPSHPDDGLLLLTSAGFIQHKIDIYDKDKTVSQLQGQYLKGYDRLTNGSFIEQYAGYAYFSKRRLINFTLGLDALFGFTQDRRSYLYDVMRTDNGNKLDILFGIRGGWFIPIFKRKSEELQFQ